MYAVASKSVLLCGRGEKGSSPRKMILTIP